MNRLLQRHLRRLALDPGSPPGTAEWQAFLERVEHAYEDGERGRYLLERSLEISSREMQDLYEELAQFTQAQIASEQSKFETVVGAMADGVLAAALDDGQLLVMNAAAREVLGDIKQVSMKHFEVHDESGERLDDEAVRTIIRSGGTLRDDHALVRGRRGVEASLSITPLSRHGQVDAYVLTFRDMEEQILLQRELRRAAEIFENVREAVIVTDADARVIQVNRAFTAMSGQTVEDVRGQVPGFLSETTYDAGFLSALWEAVHKRGSWRGEVRDRRSGGESYPLEVSIAAVNDHDDRLTNYIVIARDVSELRRAQESVDYLVHHDPLTGLPNRLLLRNRLDLAIREARSGNHNVALLHLDLDDFKTVNDSLGHGAGDMLLKEVARRLSASVSANDLLGRLGADEFCVVMRRPAGAGAAAATARRLLEVIAAPMQLEGRETVVTASTGISLYPMDGEDVHSLVKNADTALHRAKEVDRNHYEFYTEELSASAFERLSMESALRRAIRQNEFELFYQPQVALADGRICGAEALLRWRHPELGVLTPRHFLRLAEEIGLTLELGEWVLAAACQQIRRWRDSGHSSPRIAINLFGRQVQSTSLPAIVNAHLEKNLLPAGSLELEITEDFLLSQPDAALSTLRALQERGVSLAVDDFGTGYCNLVYLKNMPVDRLKIDRSFIRDVAGDYRDAAVVQAIISLGQNLGLQVLAEGVETAAQRDFLLAEGCDMAQGYFYHPPVPEAEFLQLLNSDPGTAGTIDRLG